MIFAGLLKIFLAVGRPVCPETQAVVPNPISNWSKVKQMKSLIWFMFGQLYDIKGVQRNASMELSTGVSGRMLKTANLRFSCLIENRPLMNNLFVSDKSCANVRLNQSGNALKLT